MALLFLRLEGGGDEVHADDGDGNEDEAAEDQADGDRLGGERSADEIVHGGPGREDEPGPERDLAPWRRSGCRLSWSFYRELLPQIDQRAFDDLCSMYEAGEVSPPVSETYDLSRAGYALRRLVDRKAMGKIVLTVN